MFTDLDMYGTLVHYELYVDRFRKVKVICQNSRPHAIKYDPFSAMDARSEWLIYSNSSEGSTKRARAYNMHTIY